ncbi:Copper-exporting P-type ATPase [Paenibacillus sp. CECT 9249]|uniref:heavy metal translocating P-type ATPase n=1 Tax=Paenibacillus sp. CECT 9249 TaxID=2845385 RepID=UPI001E35840B|nr:heavy metal translocating P-type ATPase [Paenibacillus sp. CECT 9249]CAH0118548.1 Copper-exporting P-type ATPase [Paenibacillus sp. CECT 9249]
METKDFRIRGMTCAACSAAIERGLNDLPGVQQTNVNAMLESARVEYDPAELSVFDIIEKVEELGYEAIVEEEANSGETERQMEIRFQQKRLIVSALLSFPLLWVMASHFSWLSWIYVPEFLKHPWVQFALATPVQFWIGKPFYVGAYRALKGGSANLDVLVALGTTSAYMFSLAATLRWVGQFHQMPGIYYETSAILITLVVFGKLLEAVVKGRTSAELKSLVELQPKTAILVKDGEETEVPAADVAVGDLLLVRPGAPIPADGEVVEGASDVDESMLTGNSAPVMKQPGDTVFGATMNESGRLLVRAARIGKHTALSQIVRAVAQAQSAKPLPIQRVADAVAGVFVPIVVTFAVVTSIIWYMFVQSGNFAAALEAGIAVLVIACPCALGLATPISVMTGSGRAAALGILFKGAQFLETTHEVDIIVFDKTGTITQGKPLLRETVVIPGDWDEQTVLRLAALAEKQSDHPLGKAIFHGIAQRADIDFAGSQDCVRHFEAQAGLGVAADVEGRQVLVGNRRLMHEHRIDISGAERELGRMEAQGRTAMLIAVDRKYAGIAAVSDALKETASAAILRLKQMGIEVIMLTGDSRGTARTIANQAGIVHVLAEILPQDRAEAVRKLQVQGHQVAMIGDGIKDASALAAADIGIAIGNGSEIAMEAADVALLRGDLNSIPDAIHLSHKTMNNMKQNLFLALAYHAIGIPIAAAGLLAPWVAGAAMALSSLSVIVNALRLQKAKLR